MHLVHVRDKHENKILERHGIDAREIVASDPERFEIIGKAISPTNGNLPTVAPNDSAVGAVLDSDTPTAIAKKLSAQFGKREPMEGMSDEVADESFEGVKLKKGHPAAATDENDAKKPRAKKKRRAKKPAAKKAAKAETALDDSGEKEPTE